MVSYSEFGAAAAANILLPWHEVAIKLIDGLIIDLWRALALINLIIIFNLILII